MTKRVEPAASPPWSGWATIEGLKQRGALDGELLGEVRADEPASLGGRAPPGRSRRCADEARSARPRSREVAVAARRTTSLSARELGRRPPSSDSASTRSSTAAERDSPGPDASWPGRKSRLTTRAGSGRSTWPVRRTQAASTGRVIGGCRRARRARDELHGRQPGERRLRALVLVDRPVLEPVEAAAGGLVAHRRGRGRCRPRTSARTLTTTATQRSSPVSVVRRPGRLGEGRDLDRLLVEAGSRVARRPARRPGPPRGGRRASARRRSQREQREPVVPQACVVEQAAADRRASPRAGRRWRRSAVASGHGHDGRRRAAGRAGAGVDEQSRRRRTSSSVRGRRRSSSPAPSAA